MRPFFLALILAAAPALTAQTPLERGRTAFEARHYAEARAPLLEAARANPRDAAAPLLLGRLALLSGNAEEAVKWLEQATQRAPRNAEAQHWMGRAYARQARRAGRFTQLRLAGRIRGAFESAVSLDPDDIGARRDLLEFYLVAPRIAGGGDDKARAQAAQLAKRSPMYGRLAEGWIAEAGKNNAAAAKAYEAAIASWPDSAAPYLALGALRQRTGDWALAFAAYDRLVARRPDVNEVNYQIGRAASLSGMNLDRGAQALDRYLARMPAEEEPPLASARLRLGAIRERQGNKPEARRQYQLALQLDPGLDDAKSGLARVR